MGNAASALTGALYVTGLIKSVGLDRSRVAVVGYHRGKAGEFGDAWQSIRSIPRSTLEPVAVALQQQGLRDARAAARAIPRNLKVSLKPLGRQLDLAFDLLRGPTSNNIPLSGGTWKLKLPGARETLEVTDVWGKAHRASNTLGSVFAGLALLTAGFSVASALQGEGRDGLLGTRHGRTGVILGASASAGLGVHALAGAFRRDPGQSFVQAFTGASWLANGKVRTSHYGAAVALGALMTYNLTGGLDRLNIKR